MTPLVLTGLLTATETQITSVDLAATGRRPGAPERHSGLRHSVLEASLQTLVNVDYESVWGGSVDYDSVWGGSVDYDSVWGGSVDYDSV